MKVPRQAFSLRAFFTAIRDGFWSLMPGIILGGIWRLLHADRGRLGPYAFVVECGSTAR